MKLNKPFHGDYPITQAYGVQSVTGKRHMGIDWALPMGTPVFAAADGMVTFAGKDATGYGNCVIIRHGDGSGTVYAHLSDIMIANGQYIFAGISVGRSGSTGTSTGPHLHFEYRRKADDYKSAIDPMPFINSPEVMDIPNEIPNPIESIGDVDFGRVEIIADGVAIRSYPGFSSPILRRATKGFVLLSTNTIKYADGLRWRLCFLPCYVAEHDGMNPLIAEVNSSGAQ